MATAQAHELPGWRRALEAVRRLGYDEASGELGDFTTTPRLLVITGIAVVIGVISAFVALILLRLIGLFTNLFFFQRWSGDLVSPAGNKLGWLEIFIPIIGALMVGLIARFGSERIRGHGIPEAIESILINGSRVEPKVALLKPISSAISIGSGGPFGAEGPIIMTGGAVGSLIAQFFHLTSSERKTLLVAGAAAGMSATFAAPVAATLLAVELLLFEWKPRSLIPVALASATAAVMRRYLLGPGPLFPTPAQPLLIGPTAMLACAGVGLVAGVLSGILTFLVYASEDLFTRLPIHWMWWPAIGGLVIGLGGLIFPQALGVGYDTIGAMLNGTVIAQVILGVLIVKSLIWAISLGSGTSGGVLAPLLMIGGAMGGVEALFLPHESVGFWPLISMAAILGGTMRSPLTAVIFAVELTHNVNVLLPLLIAVVVAHGFTVLILRRSILTEKISRRGLHLTREYSIDPLEILRVREAMRTKFVALTPEMSVVQAARAVSQAGGSPIQRLYPIVGADDVLVGVVQRSTLQRAAQQPGAASAPLTGIARSTAVVAYPDETFRTAVERMAETGLTRLPVVERGAPRRIVGMISLTDLLKARARNLEAENRRERVLPLRLVVPLWPQHAAHAAPTEPARDDTPANTV
jgi:CIC family chloride channel protein